MPRWHCPPCLRTQTSWYPLQSEYSLVSAQPKYLLKSKVPSKVPSSRAPRTKTKEVRGWFLAAAGGALAAGMVSWACHNDELRADGHQKPPELTIPRFCVAKPNLNQNRHQGSMKSEKATVLCVCACDSTQPLYTLWINPFGAQGPLHSKEVNC